MKNLRVIPLLVGAFVVLSLAMWVNGCTPTPTYVDYYVDIHGSDELGAGTSSSPWRHIQYALDHTQAAGNEIPRINLKKGIYQETLVIERSVVIKGAGIGVPSTYPDDPLTPIQEISMIVRQTPVTQPGILVANAGQLTLENLDVWGGGVRVVNTQLIVNHVEIQNSVGLYALQVEKCKNFWIKDSKIMTSPGTRSDYALDAIASSGTVDRTYLGDLFDHVINIKPTVEGEIIDPNADFYPPLVVIRDSQIAGSNIYYADGIRIQGPTHVAVRNTTITRTHPDNEPATGNYNRPYAGIQIGGWLVKGAALVTVDGVTTNGFDVGLGTNQEGFDLMVQNSNISGVSYAVQTSYYGYTNVRMPHIDLGGYPNVVATNRSIGNNVFGNASPYAFYHNVPYDAFACWSNWGVTEGQVDPQRIYDKLDSAASGRVNWTCSGQPGTPWP